MAGLVLSPPAINRFHTAIFIKETVDGEEEEKEGLGKY